MGISYYAFPGIKKSKRIEDHELANRIIENVCNHFGINDTVLFELSRKGERSYYRYLIFYFIRRYTTLSHRQITELIRDRGYSRIDHTAIVNGAKKIRNFLSVKDEKTVKDVDELIIKINLI